MELSRSHYFQKILICRVWWVNFHLKYAKIILTFHFIQYIYQNYMKISWNTIDLIYSKKSPLTSTTDSRWLWNFLQFFLMVSLFKLANIADILAFSSSLVLHGVFLAPLLTVPTTQNNQEDCNLGSWEWCGIVWSQKFSDCQHWILLFVQCPVARCEIS